MAVNEATAVPGAGPTGGRERIESLDILRGFALMGILVMNIQAFSMPSEAYMVPNAIGSLDGSNFFVWLVSHLFFDLKFMAIFSMLFGAGIVLMSRHREEAGLPVLALHYRRMGLLLLFGLAHSYLIWYGDILVPYAICGMVVVWARNWPAKRLAIAGAGLIIFGAWLYTVIGTVSALLPEVAEELSDDLAVSEQIMSAELEAYRDAWWAQSYIRAKSAAKFQFFVFPLMFFWRISGLMLLGMALYKWGVLSAAKTPRFYTRLAVAGGVLGLPLVAAGAYWHYVRDFDVLHVYGYGQLPNWFGSVGVALMFVALVMLLVRAGMGMQIKRALAAYGRMAFTNYIGQSVLATLVFYGYGLGLFGKLDRLEQLGVVAAIWFLQIIFSVVWLRYFRFGPLEWIWRLGAYMKHQTILRHATT